MQLQFDRICGKVREMRGPVQRRRGSSAVAIALLVLAQLGALSHAAAVKHVRCATHGELVEAAEIETHAADADRLVGARGDARDDDHCEVVGALSHAAAAPRSPHAAALIVPTVVGVVAAPDALVATTVYLFAPKTSPPDRWVSFT